MAAARGWLRRAIPALLVCVGALALAGPAEAGTAKLVKYRAANDDPAKQDFTFFNKGGLQLVGSCDPDGGGSQMTIHARTTTFNSTLHWGVKKGGAAFAYGDDDDFDPGTGSEDAEILEVGTDYTANSSGLLVFGRGATTPAGHAAGTVVSIKFAALENLAFDGAKDCAFFGVARVLDSTSSSRVNFRADQGDSGSFDTSGVHFDADCSESDPATLLVEAKSEVANSVVGFDAVSSGGFIFDSNGPDEDFDVGDAYGGGSDNAVGQYVFAAPSGGANVTVDALYEDRSLSTESAFAGDWDCAWLGTARTRTSGDAKRVNFRAEAGTALTKFFEKGGLILNGSCGLIGSELTVIARSKLDDAVISANRTTASGLQHDSDPEFNTSGDDYDLGSELGLSDQDGTGQIVYSKPDGSVLTIDWMALQDDDGAFGGTKTCAFVGTAEQKTA